MASKEKTPNFYTAILIFFFVLQKQFVWPLYAGGAGVAAEVGGWSTRGRVKKGDGDGRSRMLRRTLDHNCSIPSWAARPLAPRVGGAKEAPEMASLINDSYFPPLNPFDPPLVTF